MSTRDVVEMLATAYRGLVEAGEQMDERLRRQSMKLLEKAVQHPDAPAFFAAAQIAIDETEGNDPTVDDNGDGVVNPEENVDEDTPAAGPATEGVTDDEDDDATDMNKTEESVGGIITEIRPSDVIASFASNLARLRG